MQEIEVDIMTFCYKKNGIMASSAGREKGTWWWENEICPSLLSVHFLIYIWAGFRDSLADKMGKK